MIGVRGKQAIMGAAVGLILVSNLALFIPFSLFLGNSAELSVSFWAIIGAFLKPVVFFLGILALIAMLLPRSIYLLYLSLLATISLLLWIQGNLLIWDYGLLDGRPIDWSENSYRGWIEIGLWSCVLTFVLFGFRRYHQQILGFAVTVFFLQTILLTYNLAIHMPQTSVKVEANSIADVQREIYRFSSQDNIVQIIADGFQADIFAEIMSQRDLGGRLGSALTGFTFFPEHIGVFPYTHMTIPAILTGQIYRNHVSIQKHFSSTIGSRSILSVANEAGYDIDMAVPGGAVSRIYANAPNTNLLEVNNKQHISNANNILYDATKIFDLSLFRISPHFVKKHIYNDQLWFTQPLLTDQKIRGLRYFSHVEFLKRLSQRMTADRPEPVYKLIHLMLSHNPMVTNADCSYAGRVLATVRQNVINQSRCSLIEVVKLLEKMKNLGIYDSATIVLMGDHGAWVSPKNLKRKLSADKKTVSMINPSVLALATPLFAIKPPGALNTMQTSRAPSWIVDTAATIAKINGFGGEFPGESVFDLESDGPRERRFHYYNYRRSEWADDHLEPIQEFIVDGSAVDSSSWRHINTYLPNGEKQLPRKKSSIWLTVPAQ